MSKNYSNANDAANSYSSYADEQNKNRTSNSGSRNAGGTASKNKNSQNKNSQNKNIQDRNSAADNYRE